MLVLHGRETAREDRPVVDVGTNIGLCTKFLSSHVGRMAWSTAWNPCRARSTSCATSLLEIARWEIRDNATLRRTIARFRPDVTSA